MQRFLLYINERFSPVQLVPLAVLFGCAIGTLGPTLAGVPIESYRIVAIISALFLFLFRLRVLDDIKDHGHDSVHHRDRPGARGIIGQRELAWTAGATIVLEAVIAYLFGLVPFIAFLVMSVYAGVLFIEALARDRIRDFFTPYIVLHELLLVPLLVYLCLLAAVPIVALATFPLLALLAFLGALFFAIEVARKLRAPQEEGTGKDTYTAQYGVRGATLLLCSTVFVAYGAMAIIASQTTQKSVIAYLLGFLVFFALCYNAFYFASVPVPRNARVLFVTTVGSVAFFLALLPGMLWLL
ncbi:MAG: hypothetical protein AAB421_03025 [Patescibacteria group bacterium]